MISARKFLKLQFCVIGMGVIALPSACNNGVNKEYYMGIQYDEKDITAVGLRLGNALNAVPLKLNNGTAEIRMLEKDLKGVGQITIIFESKKHGSIEYIDGPISVDRKLYVKCDGGRIVIQVVNPGYL